MAAYEPDPYYLNGPDPAAWDDVPAPLPPGLQPWQVGEEPGEIPGDDWRGHRFLAGGGWEEPPLPEPLTRCRDCQGAGCGWCGHAGWDR